MAHACNLHTWEAEAGGPGVQGQLGLRDCLKNNWLTSNLNQTSPNHPTNKSSPAWSNYALVSLTLPPSMAPLVKEVCSQVSGLLLSSFPVSVNPSLGTSHLLSNQCAAPRPLLSSHWSPYSSKETGVPRLYSFRFFPEVAIRVMFWLLVFRGAEGYIPAVSCQRWLRENSHEKRPQVSQNS